MLKRAILLKGILLFFCVTGALCQRADTVRVGVEEAEALRRWISGESAGSGVSLALWGDSVAVIRLSFFGDGTATAFRKAIRRVDDDGISALVLDVRGNRGGVLGVMVEVSSYFVEGGRTIVTKRSFSEDDVRYTASRRSRRYRGRVVVLVDGRTASSAELLAGVLQDYRRGVIVGRRTRGRWQSERRVDCSDGSMLLVTASWCELPSGRTVEGGIVPDVTIEHDDADADAALMVAFDLLRREDNLR